MTRKYLILLILAALILLQVSGNIKWQYSILLGALAIMGYGFVRISGFVLRRREDYYNVKAEQKGQKS